MTGDAIGPGLNVGTLSEVGSPMAPVSISREGLVPGAAMNPGRTIQLRVS